MPTEAAEATCTCSEVSGMFDQALKAFGDTLKAATKAQEDAVKFWSEAVSKAAPGRAVGGEWIPMAQKNAQEYLRLLESSYRRNAELVKKVMASQGGGNGSADKQSSEWLEASLEVARANAQDLVSTNMRVAQAWSEAFQKSAQQTAAWGQQKAAEGN